MATTGAIAATATDSVIVAADEYRGYVMLYHTANNPMFIGIGTAGVVRQGNILSSTFSSIKITGPEATKAIHGICDTGQTTTGTYATGSGD